MSRSTHLARLWKAPPRDLLATLEAAALLLFARALIRFVPFARWRRLLGPLGDREKTADERHLAAAQGVARHVTRAARYLPIELVCLPRALATRWMLRRRGIDTALHLGARPSAAPGAGTRIELHAWLMVGRTVIMGAEERDSFTAFQRAVSPGAPRG